jgi:uncharacterized protein YecT (DUF1311 family)
MAPNMSHAEKLDILNQCIEKTNAIDPAIHACLADEKTKQEAQLNKIYKNLQHHSPKPMKAKLITAQRHWLLQRKLDCDLVTESGEGNIGAPGTLDLQTRDACFVDATVKRVAFLRRISILSSE